MKKSDKAKDAQKPPYMPTERERVVLSEYLAKEEAAIPAPRMKVVREGKHVSVDPIHPHIGTWALTTTAAFGATHHAFASVQINHAVQASIKGDDPAPKVDVLNGILAGVAGIAPRDEVESMLAVQMIATHNVAMEMLKRAMLDQPSAQVCDGIVSRAAKLLRTYTAQVEALGRYRHGGKQQVIVQHQHVGISADKAVIGINAPNGDGGGVTLEIGDQAHVQSITHAPVSPMRGEDKERCAVPATRHGKRTL
ncbi:hypothetical protein A6A04_14770 [Paramagnetospirillum marisnigri]|uniref:Uncharacterized protein n=1 Tax=Paramagnetospirillum marisnigri TaxID=1285242 RepID=A0A178MVB5_9PROT|nr:hypothetical protein [Paramagnetospirillum marisnigri]OAN52977.1 hypothetical protein A6A04_14770 [Paramagnetospirillum marisnigri]